MFNDGKQPVRVVLSGIVLTVVLVAASSRCGDDSGNGPATDGGPTSDSSLWPCQEPGRACNAHDPCAINPVCGNDHLCHPSMMQNCDDELDCTDDSCGGPGQCINKPKEGFCAVFVKEGTTSTTKCYLAEDPHPTDPCQKCDPSVSQTKWSDASGAKCDDEDPCTMNDVCKEGECRGEYFGNLCGDGLQCTDDICDGKGGCDNKLLKGWCIIEKQCYKDGEKDASGCSICVASKDPFKWTNLPNLCKIGASCFKPGEKDATGCGVCDPSKNPLAWSQATDGCLIQGTCYKTGATTPSGCGVCDPQKSFTSWTPTSGSCLIRGTCYPNAAKSATGCGVCDAGKDPSTWTPAPGVTTKLYDFESGLGGFTVDTPVQKVGWQVSTKRARGGTSSLYYGDPAAGTYDNGAQNKGTATSASVTLPAGKKAALIFWLYLDTETATSFDVLTIHANSTMVWQKSESTVPASSYRTWIPVEVDLSALAGSSIQLLFSFDTKDAWSNTGEGVFIDDLAVITNCAP
jgi:hypothetical protein